MKILICDGLDTEAVEHLKKNGHDVDLRKSITKADLLAVVDQFEVLVVRSATQVTAEIIAKGTRLKLIARGGVGLDNIDADAAKSRGIAVQNTPAATSVSVAEYTLALMLGLARQIPQACASMKNGAWDRKSFSGTELFGKTLGIVGFGRIGQEVAKRARAFHMTSLIFDLSIDREIVDALEVEAASSLDELLGRSHYITLHLPFTPQTENLLNRDRLARVRKGAYVINTARGGLIDDAALAENIQSGHIAGAALDVYHTEPPTAGASLLALPQVITCPHLGGSTSEGQKRAGLEVAKIVCEFVQK